VNWKGKLSSWRGSGGGTSVAAFDSTGQVDVHLHPAGVWFKPRP
jgi:hypothetical protein